MTKSKTERSILTKRKRGDKLPGPLARSMGKKSRRENMRGTVGRYPWVPGQHY